MALSLKPDAWVYVVVMNPGGHEQYVGMADSDGTSFIPAFLTKDDAQCCLPDMPREKRKKYEIHAVLYQELEKDASASGFQIYLLDDQGRILEKTDDAEKKPPLMRQ